MIVSRRRRLSIFAIGMTLLLAACGTPEERVAEFIEEGQALMAEGDLDRAALNFRNALRIEPRNATALMAMGRINEARERLQRAYAAYRAAAEADPTMIEAHNAYAVLALTGGELDDVRMAAEGILAVDPAHPDGLALSAALALREERFDDAETLARQALAAAPDHVNATSALAGVHHARDELDAAVGVLDAHFANFGGNIPLSLLKIQLLGAVGDDRGVEEGFRELLSFAPDNADFRIAFADFYRALGDAAAAESVLRSTIDELETSASVAVSLVRLVAEREGTEAALAEIEQLGDADEETRASLAFLAADMLATAERFDEAEARLQVIVDEAGEASPRGRDAQAGIATIAHVRGDSERALSILAAVLEGDAQHRGANYLNGLLAVQRGQFGEAVASARSALGRDPNWVPGLRLLAEAHLRANEIDLASDALVRVVRSSPGDVEAASVLAQLLAERGDLDAALRTWDLVIRGAEDPNAALSSTAEIAIQQENWNRASADIDELLATPEGQMRGTLLAGSLRLAQNDPEGAREWFERAQTMDPDGSAALLGLVRTYLAEEDLDGALARLQARTEAAPDDALAHSMTAQLHAQAGRLDEAARAYRAAIAAQPNWASAYRELAAVEELRGRVDAALEALEAGVVAVAAPDELRLEQAFVQQRDQRYDAAIQTYLTLLEDGNQDDVVANNYAALVADFAFEDAQKLERAFELASRFAISNEAYFLDTLGWVNYRRGDHAQALTYLRRASALRPDDPQIHYHVGAVLHAMGDVPGAVSELEQALPPDTPYYPGIDHARTLLEELRQRLAEEGTSDGAS